MSINQIVKTNKIERYLERIINKELFWILTFSFLTAFAAQVSIPVQPVPFTLQTMLVVLAGAFLGAKNGAISQIIYLMLGIIGIPVFADLSFGLAKLFGPTGGYLLCFPFAAYLTGYLIERKRNLLTIIIAFLISNILILFFGALYLSTFYNSDFKYAFFAGALIFSFWDLIKICAAISIYFSFSRKYPKLPK
jgi:biotin transport system substrate-specific component